MTIPADAVMERVLRRDTSADPADKVISAQAAMSVVEESLRNADGVIDGYLCLRKPTAYVVPLTPVRRS